MSDYPINCRRRDESGLKHIGDFLRDLEEGLYNWNYPGITTLSQLTELYHIIPMLMEETLKTISQKLKTLLLYMEFSYHQARYPTNPEGNQV